MERKAANCHVFLKMVGGVEMSRESIVDLNIPKVFAETLTQSAAGCFADEYYFA